MFLIFKGVAALTIHPHINVIWAVHLKREKSRMITLRIKESKGEKKWMQLEQRSRSFLYLLFCISSRKRVQKSEARSKKLIFCSILSWSESRKSLFGRCSLTNLKPKAKIYKHELFALFFEDNRKSHERWFKLMSISQRNKVKFFLNISKLVQ